MGLKAVNELKSLFPGIENLAPVALKWILNFEQVSCVIPGASKTEQVLSNLSVYEVRDFSTDKIIAMNNIYNKYIKKEVHNLW
jgi:aryl-alcohol dehydrogenase-like predicted oxidoreductase